MCAREASDTGGMARLRQSYFDPRNLDRRGRGAVEVDATDKMAETALVDDQGGDVVMTLRIPATAIACTALPTDALVRVAVRHLREAEQDVAACIRAARAAA